MINKHLSFLPSLAFSWLSGAHKQKGRSRDVREKRAEFDERTIKVRAWKEILLLCETPFHHSCLRFCVKTCGSWLKRMQFMCSARILCAAWVVTLEPRPNEDIDHGDLVFTIATPRNYGNLNIFLIFSRELSLGWLIRLCIQSRGGRIPTGCRALGVW